MLTLPRAGSRLHVLWLTPGEYFEALASFPVSVHETREDAVKAEDDLKTFIRVLQDELPDITTAIDIYTVHSNETRRERLLAVAERFEWTENDIPIVEAVLETEILETVVKDAPFIPTPALR